jgi:hypothetical protein
VEAITTIQKHHLSKQTNKGKRYDKERTDEEEVTTVYIP